MLKLQPRLTFSQAAADQANSASRETKSPQSQGPSQMVNTDPDQYFLQQSLTTCCPQLDEHLLTPSSITSLEVHGASNTRRSLLDHVFKPLVEDSADPGTTLGQVLTSVQAATKKLARFGAPSPSSTNPLLSANP
jgi:outer membrane protein insertion porin family